MMAKKTRKFPGMVTIARRTDTEAVKYERLVGGKTVAHWVLSVGKVIINFEFQPTAVIAFKSLDLLLAEQDFTPLCQDYCGCLILRLDKRQRSVSPLSYTIFPHLCFVQAWNYQLITFSLLGIVYTNRINIQIRWNSQFVLSAQCLPCTDRDLEVPLTTSFSMCFRCHIEMFFCFFFNFLLFFKAAAFAPLRALASR